MKIVRQADQFPIPIKKERGPRGPAALRTCCPEHMDSCKFGRRHVWVYPWVDTTGEWHDTMRCDVCGGICGAELRAEEEYQNPIS